LQQRNEVISRVIVTGGSAKLRNFIQFLRNELGLSVEFGSTGKIICPEKIRNEFEESFQAFSVALGLGLREVVEDEN
jgi:Tfp pilus assembly PilM family ATPase